ncbi:T9SS type A sorting domain-containing protein [bacterium]|nr:T9SS type A sorting domain-containing protein [bacterium]
MRIRDLLYLAFLLTIVTLPFTHLATAQPEWPIAVIESNFDPQDACSFDYDGDGDTDLIVFNGYESTVLLYTWTGDGWSEEELFFNDGYAYNLRAADLDGDSDIDLVVHDYEWGLFWYERDGDDWLRHTIWEEQWYHCEPEIADLDQDGDFDIVSSKFYSNRIEWWSNDGAGSFTLQTISSDFSNPLDLAVADLNGDEVNDIVVTALSQLVWLERSDNNWIEHIVSNDYEGGQVATGDIDGDGRIDIATAFHGQWFCWWANTVDGWEIRNLQDTVFNPVDLMLVDADSDGDLDAIGGFTDSVGRLYVWENSNGQLNGGEIAHNMEQFNGLAVGDYDADGLLDLIGLSQVHGLTAWMASSELDWDRLDVRMGYFGSGDLSVADFDMDGDLDIVGSYGYERLAWWKNQGTGWSSTLLDEGSYPWTVDIITTDLDEDGQPDFLVSTSTNLEIRWWWQEEGDWQSIPITDEYELLWASSLEIADIDQDGDNDVFAGWVDGLSWCENTGDVEWTIHEITDAPNAKYIGLAVADLTGHGDPDIIGLGNSGQLNWWSSEDQEWEQHSIGAIGEAGRCVRAVQLDGDDELEIFAASDVSISMFDRTGMETWNESQPITDVYSAQDLEFTDLDGDDLIDLVITNVDGIYRSELGPDGWITVALNTNESGLYLDSEVADLDDDGDLDILVGMYYLGLMWLENTGDTFVAHEPAATLPQTTVLYPNHPNPFNPTTQLTFALPRPGHTSLVVYDATGREVVRLVDGALSAGTHRAMFDGTGLASGVYFATLTGPNQQVQTQKLVLVK